MDYTISAFDFKKYSRRIITRDLSEIVKDLISKLPADVRKEAQNLKFKLNPASELDTKFSSTYNLDFVGASSKLKEAMRKTCSYITAYNV